LTATVGALAVAVAFGAIAAPADTFAQALDPLAQAAGSLPISLDGSSSDYVGAVKIVLLFAALALAPTLLLSVTSFTRIVVVLSLLRQAVGVMQLPPNRVVLSLAMFLTFFTMAPVWSKIDEVALTPLEQGALNEKQALLAAAEPIRGFMLQHTREEDLTLFVSLSQAERPANAAELSTLVIVPAFMLSELRVAFEMGALLFLPFLVIDLVVASVLMSMGMMMLPPMTISLPLKLLVFVSVDGWGLVMRSLATSVMGA
jgi:flagellar biosynthetic protein FliP